jgi:hypothetical protein
MHHSASMQNPNPNSNSKENYHLRRKRPPAWCVPPRNLVDHRSQGPLFHERLNYDRMLTKLSAADHGNKRVMGENGGIENFAVVMQLIRTKELLHCDHFTGPCMARKHDGAVGT